MHSSFSRNRFVACVLSSSLFLMTGLGRGDQPSAGGPILSYSIERLGNAQDVTVVSPGAAGSLHCFRLTHLTSSWSRFNWPFFLPVSGIGEIRFHARREAAMPSRLAARLLHSDGSEWQSISLTLSETWTEYVLTGPQFHLFRGGDPATAGELNFSQVAQFQLVPLAKGDGEGVFLVDEIRFLPDGPVFTAEENEWRGRADALQQETARMADLISRWTGELERLEHQAERLTVRRERLQCLLDSSVQPELRRDALAHLGGQAIYRRPECKPAVSTFSPDEYRSELARNTARRPDLLSDFPDAWTPSTSVLYGAVSQDEPMSVTRPGGGTILRHRIRFTAEAQRQTVFTRIRPPTPLDVRGRVLILRMRCTASALNSEWPLILRLETLDAEGRESWGDLRPSVLPGATVGDITFDPTSPARGVRFEPERVAALAIRTENSPGVPQEFDLEIEDIHLGWPDAVQSTRRNFIEKTENALLQARMKVYRLRDSIAVAEHALAVIPNAEHAYWQSILEAADDPDAAAELRPSEPLPDGKGVPEGPRRPALFTARATLSGRTGILEIQAEESPGLLLAEVLDAEGMRVAAAAAVSPSALCLTLPNVRTWSPGIPHRYRLRMALVDGETVLAAAEKPVTFRSVTLMDQGPTALLRHVVAPCQPDWTLLYNGHPSFPRVACYHWPGSNRDYAAATRMLGDLWVDGFRYYGFALSAGTWEQLGRAGISEFASAAPSYASLGGWEDIPFFDSQYRARLRLHRQLSDHAVSTITQIGNEVELAMWGASLATAFPDAQYQPLDLVGDVLRQNWQPSSPVMYVRAGSFRAIPPLPQEDICGINQYTGRYSGRMDEASRDLAELVRQSLFHDRPVAITEWMGPKYSWATGGIGGVTRRGAAYYLERYWRAMIDTPGIVASSEFTLNWVIAPFEDLTTQTREEAWRDRPKHSGFGGGYTADHVPEVAPEHAVRGPCFRSMQAFQSPLYIMMRRPGSVTIALEGIPADAAIDPSVLQLADDLSGLGKAVSVRAVNTLSELDAIPGHLVLLADPEGQTPVRTDLETRGCIAPVPPGVQDVPAMAIQTRIRENHPGHLLCALTAADTAVYRAGLERLCQAAGALRELNALEGAMTRALAIVDKDLVKYYERYLLEFAGRGYLFDGDDTRETLVSEEIFNPDGSLRPAWQDLSALLLDRTEPLSDEELRVVTRLLEKGVNIVLGEPCYTANPGLQAIFPVTIGTGRSLAECLPVLPPFQSPVPVSDLGSADLTAIRAFAPKTDLSAALRICELDAPGATPVARTQQGAPVAVCREYGAGRIILFGCGIGEIVKLHYTVTHAGKTHPIYDRDTACGLERLSRTVINCCRLGCSAEQLHPALFIRIIPEHTCVPAAEPARFSVMLTDAEGAPVAGQLRARWRTILDGRTRNTGAYVDVTPVTDGCFDLICMPTQGEKPGETGPVRELPFKTLPPDGKLAQLSLQFKAWSPGMIPADAACCVIIDRE